MASMAALGGFATGLVEGQQQQLQNTQKQQMLQMAMAEGKVRLQKEEIDLQQAEMMIAANKEIADRVKGLNSGGAGPDQSPGSMAERAANVLDISAQVYASKGFGQQAAETMERAMRMRESGFALQTAQIKQDDAKREWVSDHVAALQPGDEAGWNAVKQQFQALFKEPVAGPMQGPLTADLKHKILTQADAIKEQSLNALQRVEMKKDIAQEQDALAHAQLARVEAAEKAVQLDNLRKFGGLEKPPSGLRWKVDAKGKPILDKEGKPQFEAITGGPADPEAPKGGHGAGLAKAQYQRVITASNQAMHEIKNIMEMPATVTRGYLGAIPEESLTSVTKASLVRGVSSEDVQYYNTMATGLNRFIASIEAAGMASGLQEFSKQVAPQVTLTLEDKVGTKLMKMAELRQNITSGIETLLDNPDVAPAQKARITGIITELEKAIPFTPHDVLVLRRGDTPKTATLADVAKGKGLGPPDAPMGGPNVPVPAGTDDADQQAMDIVYGPKRQGVIGR